MSRWNQRVLFLTKYSRINASSRYRILQYFPMLEEYGIQCVASPLFDDSYVTHLYTAGRRSLIGLIRGYLRRLVTLLTVGRFAGAVIEYELLPYLPATLERILVALRVPYVAEYDDALFHQYDQNRFSWVRWLLGQKIAVVMRHARLVIAGNEYLADYALQAGAGRVEVLPTVVDLEGYPPLPPPGNPVFTIGWIGTPKTSKYLKAIAPALTKVCAGGQGRVILVGAGAVKLPGVPVELRPWSQTSEVTDIAAFDVGIMPLPDEPWTQGKCGLKLIQYMACSRPVVASPVGVNKELVDNGHNGFLATTVEDWVRVLSALRANRELRKKMGRAGREKVETRYCLRITAPRLVSMLSDVMNRCRFVAADPEDSRG